MSTAPATGRSAAPGELIDLDTGTLHREVFESEPLLRTELATVFTRSWLFLGHESRLRRPGDFFTAVMGQDHVIVTRGRDGRIRALLNVCRHRGMRVCRADSGSTPRFTCSYHGWSYDGTGALVEVPNHDDGYEGRLPLDRWGLVPVTRVESYRGFVFGCWDAQAPSLHDYLDAYRGVLDWAADGLDQPELVGPIKWRLQGNWKLAAEQFANDTYHPQTAHLSATSLLDVNMPTEGRELGSRYGHGWTIILPEDPNYTAFTFGRSPEDAAPGHQALIHGTVFPNFSMLADRVLRVWHPRSVDDMEIWSWVMVDSGWSAEQRRQAMRMATLTFSSTGIVETDDSENWSEIQAVAGGHVTGRTALNYQMGLGTTTTGDPAVPGFTGDVGHILNDVGARAFYRRWLELMEGPAPELPQTAPAPMPAPDRR
ncbi:aromatic ring-hydroxylating dioxygenase subunit alpha [Nocardiopsis sp. EMB25]|uniref:aromatic ring-hydroxylating oxygenase subunit alpha n=1 Tax=Nocardiopsis TaxID=2013 RepID=UPI00034BE275|nr:MULTISPECIES: aromatic ring-hydroxylating dioxygenase subunit alpha [Nocardiopsis]MCY9783600.1 aromatic ring-hydroxylating dioxygenase subunit alpha [Nocardiopsis sp. EMB25]